MLDTDCWDALEGILSTIDDNRRPDATDGDAFGRLHVLLFGESSSVAVAPVRPSSSLHAPTRPHPSPAAATSRHVADEMLQQPRRAHYYARWSN